MDRQNDQMGSEEVRLDALFQAYRASCPDPEASANFMPQLWQKIEARERSSTMFGRLARNLLTAALALSSIMAIALTISHSRMSALPSETYVEVLAEDQARQSLDYFEPVRIEPAADRHEPAPDKD
jgi:hypothetical protein